MNKKRREEICKIKDSLYEIKDKLENVKMDEEMAFDSMPENLQGSIKGEESEEAVDYMDEAISQIEEAIEQLDNIN